MTIAVTLRAKEDEMAQVTCPVCRGEEDPVKLAFDSLCAMHLAQVTPISEERIKRALEEGIRAREEAIAATPPVMPPRGFFR
jgi:hypothetical protein